MKLVARKWRRCEFQQRENQLAAFFFFGRSCKRAHQRECFGSGSHAKLQNSMADRTSEGRFSNARQIASRLSMLGRLAPRSIELICEMLSLVEAARSLRDQSRSTRSILI